MENLDPRDLLDWRRAGQRALLVPVVRSWGSSPRFVGSILAVAENGCLAGSVRGGCVEDDIVERYQRYQRVWRTWQLAPTGVVRFGRRLDGPCSLECRRHGIECERGRVGR